MSKTQKEAFLTVRVTDEDLAALQARASQDERTVAATVRLAIREYLQREETK